MKINTSQQISFTLIDINLVLKKKKKTREWIRQCADQEGYSIFEINYSFCSDEYLHKINLEYLDHDTYTDIITFDHSIQPKSIISDIFISTERVKENAKNLSIPFLQELNRVLIHGILHLCGYEDHSDDEKKEMRKKEDYYLSLLDTI